MSRSPVFVLFVYHRFIIGFPTLWKSNETFAFKNNLILQSLSILLGRVSLQFTKRNQKISPTGKSTNQSPTPPFHNEWTWARESVRIPATSISGAATDRIHPRAQRTPREQALPRERSSSLPRLRGRKPGRSIRSIDPHYARWPRKRPRFPSDGNWFYKFFLNQGNRALFTRQCPLRIGFPPVPIHA